MYRNTTKDMSFSQGDLMIRQCYMKEAGAMVWEIMEFRLCAGKHAHEGDHAWLAYGDHYIEPFATRERALEYLAEIENRRAETARKIYAWAKSGGTLD